MTNYKEETIGSYNKNAKEFSSRYKDMMNLEKRYEFQRFIDLLKGSKILDLGCGAGHHSIYFKEKGLDVDLIDLSEGMINLCREKGLKAQIMDIENLEFQDKAFDGIWATTSLLHIPKSNLDEVIKKMYKILKDEGLLFVSVKEGKGEKFVEDKTGGKKRFFAFWEEEELKKIFDNYFFLIETQKTQEKEIVYLKAFFRKK